MFQEDIRDEILADMFCDAEQVDEDIRADLNGDEYADYILSTLA